MSLVRFFRRYFRTAIADMDEREFTALEGGATGGVPLSRIDPEAQAGSLTWIVDVPAGESTLLGISLNKN